MIRRFDRPGHRSRQMSRSFPRQSRRAHPFPHPASDAPAPAQLFHAHTRPPPRFVAVAQTRRRQPRARLWPRDTSRPEWGVPFAAVRNRTRKTMAKFKIGGQSTPALPKPVSGRTPTNTEAPWPSAAISLARKSRDVPQCIQRPEGTSPVPPELSTGPGQAPLSAPRHKRGKRVLAIICTADRD